MGHASGHRVSLVLPEGDGGAVFEIDQEFAVEDQEELVLVVVLVPVELAFEDAESHDSIVYRGQRLVEPGLVRRDLGTGDRLRMDACSTFTRAPDRVDRVEHIFDAASGMAVKAVKNRLSVSELLGSPGV